MNKDLQEREIDTDKIYDEFRARGYNYGDAFRATLVKAIFTTPKKHLTQEQV